MKSKIIIIFSWLLVFVTLAIIFYFSLQNSSKSSSVSDSFIDNTIGNINNGDLLENLGNKYSYDFVAGVIRKIGHILEYALLGFSTFNALFLTFNKKKIKLFFITIFFVLVIASLDEFFQTLSDRNGSIKDVLIDLFGGLLGIIGILFFYFVIKLIKREFKENKKIKIIIYK